MENEPLCDRFPPPGPYVMACECVDCGDEIDVGDVCYKLPDGIVCASCMRHMSADELIERAGCWISEQIEIKAEKPEKEYT